MNTPQKKTRVGLIGTGYISDFHALALRKCPGAELVAVCDSNPLAAQAFGRRWKVQSFTAPDQMLSDASLEAVHVLTPPDSHASLAELCVRRGMGVLIEKPFATSSEEADRLCSAAADNGVRLGVNHNFLFAKPYVQVREAVNDGHLGPIDYVCINHFYELNQIRSGPYDAWMLRSPENVVFEIGPHLASIVLDLAGPMENVQVTADRDQRLPGGATVFRRWRIRANCGRTAVDININLAAGFPQRTVYVRGLFGAATVDFDANTVVLQLPTGKSLDFDRYSRSRDMARQQGQQAFATLRDYIGSKIKPQWGASPYQASIDASVAAFHRAAQVSGLLDTRLDAGFAKSVLLECEKITQAAHLPKAAPATVSGPLLTSPPTVLVTGATGFIGKELTKQLIAAGYTVRALVRGSGAVLEEHLQTGRLELFRGDIRKKEDIEAALQGIDCVFHLARGNAKAWEGWLEEDVKPTQIIADACLKIGTKRLVYTGTIDSYYAGSRAGIIDESTPLDPNIKRRNHYARAKAESERLLLRRHAEHGLPVVIVRPGIVVGPGGSPFHWGVGKFTDNVCDVWGRGDNLLPFVLCEDVAAGLILSMTTPGIEGRSYNLVDIPCLSARDYLARMQVGARFSIVPRYRPLWQFFAMDVVKWIAKVATHHPDRHRIPSYRDWDSRSQRARFSGARAKSELNWQPTGSRAEISARGIDGAIQYWIELL